MPFAAAAQKSCDELRKIENELYGLSAAMARVGVTKVAGELKDIADRIEAEAKALLVASNSKTDEDARTATASSRSILEAVTAGIAIGQNAAATAAENKDDKT